MKTILAPVYIKREGAIKWEYCYQLGSDKIYELYNEYCTVMDQIETAIEGLSELLTIKIKEQESDDNRKILINIKRDIFNLRNSLLKEVQESQAVIENAGITKEISEFVLLFEKKRLLEEEFKVVYEKEELEERKVLRKAYVENAEVLDKAIKFVHPTILDKLKSYINIPSEEHRAKQKKCDDTLAKIITRAAHKTSPFSTLTHVGAGVMDEKQKLELASNERNYTITRFNIAYALRAFEKIMTNRAIVENSRFKFADTLVLLRDKFYWTILEDNPEKRKKVYKSVDKLITVKAAGVLVELYHTFARREEFSFEELYQFLIQKGYEDEKAKTLIFNLVEKQFFTNVIFLDQNSDNIIRDFIQIIETSYPDDKKAELQDVIDILHNINDELKSFDYYEAKEQLISFKKVEKEFEKLSERLDMEYISSKQILYQDSLLTETESINSKDWQPIFDTFVLFQRFSMIFDIAYRFQLILGRKFYEKFGNEKVSVKEKEHIILDTLLTSLIEHTALWDNQLRISSEDFGIEEIARLDDIKNKFLQELISKDDKAYVNLPKELLESYIAEVPEIAKQRSQSNSFFVQNTENKEIKILNDFYAGNLIFFGRFLRNLSCISDSERVKQYIKRTITDRNVADMFLMFGFNANRRMVLTEKAVTLPNNRVIDNSDHKFKQIMDWRDLYLQYDADSKRINIFSESEEIKVQFLGTLVTTLLPAIPAMLHLLNFNVVLLKDIGYSMVFDFLEKQISFEVKPFPRICVNTNVVVSRRRWLVDVSAMNKIINSKDNEVVNNCLDFIRKYNIPRRVFVSKFFYKNDGIDIADDNTDKPMYMDFSSPILTVIFRKCIEKTKYMMIEEILPSHLYNKEEEYVGEYIFEITACEGIVSENVRQR